MSKKTKHNSPPPLSKVTCRKCRKETELHTEGLFTWRCHECGLINDLAEVKP